MTDSDIPWAKKGHWILFYGHPIIAPFNFVSQAWQAEIKNGNLAPLNVPLLKSLYGIQDDR